jgi:hypothetical protein
VEPDTLAQIGEDIFGAPKWLQVLYVEASGHLFCSCVMFMSQMNAPFVHLRLAEEE